LSQNPTLPTTKVNDQNVKKTKKILQIFLISLNDDF
jgi:hypothetical protein